ncbi:MAG: hypothetical protein OSJ59_20310, partial [Lachnospiraceae bacterium]|nr:hypothetical protein [Lachnospiraceae bacterium]
ANGFDIMSIFRDVINEWYVADTSRKIKTVFKSRMEKGLRCSGISILFWMLFIAVICAFTSAQKNYMTMEEQENEKSEETVQPAVGSDHGSVHGCLRPRQR